MSKWIPVKEKFITVDAKSCTGCGNCITICGGAVFEMKGDKSVIAHIEQCLECGNCEIACPVDAIKFCVPKGGTGIIYECG
jgi:ferredoxin-like protein FixX